MTFQVPKVSLEGITLEMMVSRLVEIYGWAELGERITIRCFTDNPSIKSSLNFLRKTPWARKKVENLYIKFRKSQLLRLAKLARGKSPDGPNHDAETPPPDDDESPDTQS